ncbi:hypothetical protein AVEN_13180-1 [Araneus ventricosus]|uniref:Mos1 transposase HTH domain-containing protein n=1 Tax=Araneus ventricosus TaxID=182803 RepID=A0A4Y2VRF4_ARAVE|nr:hypothetical protein AVEN_13180-1 [Araneus ventricosus]
MPQSIENPADCEIQFVVRFLNAKDVKAAEIHRQISEGNRSGRPSVITEDLVQKVDGKLLENRRFTISSLSNGCPQVSRSVIYGIVTEHIISCARYGQVADFYEDGIQKLVVRYDICLNIGEN